MILLCLFVHAEAQKVLPPLESPNAQIKINLEINANGELFYAVLYKQKEVLEPSRLGLVRSDGDFSKGLAFQSASQTQSVSDQYVMVNAKRKNISYKANRKTYQFSNANRQTIEVVFQLSNDGVAFRYVFPEKSGELKEVKEELTSFHFDPTTRAWLQPMQVSKSGWEQTNPAYEEHYQQNIPVGTVSPSGAGWVYPALFKKDDVWMLITEAALDSNYCATRLQSQSQEGIYRVGFPDPKEIFPGGGLVPKGVLPFSSPWRVITIGNLKTIAESTLGTDLAKPSINIDPSFVKPGKSSWSWIMSKDDSIVYTEQKRYIDFAADMHWQYCLIDVNWDRKIGYDKIKELAHYAASKNVGLLLWYNSAGSWNTVKYTPKDKLLKHEDRVKEFTRLNELGIKGLKIDFFGGDGQSVIKYYIDILNDAAKHKLMVNFHGATLPRGWHRTYPNLLTTEAVRGFEMVTFTQQDADKQPMHCTMLPFTRNVFDPMDFTPMNLYRIPTSVKRQTTSGFELALSVIFQSGIQHYAESPAGMSQMPDYVRKFLQGVPSIWEDIRFIDGFPGEFVVLARKSGNKWYVAGINGQGKDKTVEVDLSAFGKKSATIISDSSDKSLEEKRLAITKKQSLTMSANGGFVIVVE